MSDNNTRISDFLRRSGAYYLIFALLYIFLGYFFGSLGFIVVTIVGMFLNTSSNTRKEGQLSAYAILNPGFRRILGDLKLDQLERQLFNRQVESDDEKSGEFVTSPDEKYSDDEMNYPISKFSNKKCPRCNSGKKYKKCCALLLKG
ncbi:putative conserved domain (SAYSvFN) family protein [Cryptosporidium felis]|nr:putative conserved domain (SAYSvFN) family protein [Cryptosporidium felis]